jgi:hypothetical protein
MTGLINKFTGKLRAAALLAVGATVGMAGFANTAAAEDKVRVEAKAEYGDGHGRDYRHGDERRHDAHRRGPRRYRHDNDHGHGHGHHGDRDRSDIKIDIDFNSGRTKLRRETEYAPRHHERRVRYWVRPVYRTVTERVWVEPVYRTESDRVWVEPVYETVYEEVHVPARYEVREIVKHRHGRRIVIRERVLIKPACVERVPKEVCVSEGRWDVVERRVCVSEGRWNVIEKRVCVSEGRWDYRVERVEVSGHEEETLLDLRF